MHVLLHTSHSSLSFLPTLAQPEFYLPALPDSLCLSSLSLYVIS